MYKSAAIQLRTNGLSRAARRHAASHGRAGLSRAASRNLMLVAGIAVMAALVRIPAFADDREVTRGAAISQGTIYTWGSRITRWRNGAATPRQRAASPQGFGEGGCVDRAGAILLQDGYPSGPLVLFTTAGGRVEWDRRVEMHDCIFTELLGRYGALLTDHYGQVRFYEGPGLYTEIYSFYTPSRQAGLLLADVDQDGLPDIFCGNYWIRSPRRFDLPWRLFAINTRHKTPDAATMQLARRGRDLFAVQAHMNPGALLRYTPTVDPAAIWDETVIASDLRYPHAIVSTPWGLFVAENDGPGSGIYLVQDTGPLQRIATTDGVHSLFYVNGEIRAVGRNAIRVVSAADMRRRR